MPAISIDQVITSVDCLHRSFSANHGSDTEHFLVITAPGKLEFKQQMAYIEAHYAEKLKSLGLSADTAVFRRVFLSDSLNQIGTIQSSRLLGDSQECPTAVSIIQQTPLPDSKIALLAYHIQSSKPLERKRLSTRHVLLNKNGLGHLWSTRLCCQDADKSLSCQLQTKSVFENLLGTLYFQKGSLYHNCVRTWVYVKNIDIFYKSMVDERRSLFAQHGLTPQTHYIASTGIEGGSAHRNDLIVMDAYSILGLDPRQVSYLNDFKMLCATKDYSVTFERGTRIAYADRVHCYISGTASIDDQGDVVHPQDVLKQLDRTLLNIEALLKAGGASLNDMMYMIVYLRDAADFHGVWEELNQRLPRMPMVILRGAVCRPEWLIEIEGVAAVSNNQECLPMF